MKKWVGVIAPISIIFLLTSFSNFRSKSTYSELPNFLKLQDVEMGVAPDSVNLVEFYPGELVSLKKEFHGFKEALAFKESQGKYDTVNSLGYLGKYQFGKNTLQLLNIKDPQAFIENPQLQEKAFRLNVARNKWILRRDIKRFVGKRINGITVTESGIVAAAHLAGAGNVKKYLRSYGKEDFSDAYGSSVQYYLRKFQGFDISSVPQKHNPKI